MLGGWPYRSGSKIAPLVDGQWETLNDRAARWRRPEIIADIPNYTNVQPTVQVSEVRL